MRTELLHRIKKPSEVNEMHVYIVIRRISGSILGVFADESKAHEVADHANYEAVLQGGGLNEYRVSAEPIL